MTRPLTEHGPECWGWDAEAQQSVPLPENCPDEFPWLTTTTTAATTTTVAPTTSTTQATTTTEATTTTSTTGTTTPPADAQQADTPTTVTEIATATSVEALPTTVLPGLEVATTTTVASVPTSVPTLPVTGGDLWLLGLGGALIVAGCVVALVGKVARLRQQMEALARVGVIEQRMRVDLHAQVIAEKQRADDAEAALIAETQIAEQYRSVHKSAQAELRQWRTFAPNAHVATEVLEQAQANERRLAAECDRLRVELANVQASAITARLHVSLLADIAQIARRRDLPGMPSSDAARLEEIATLVQAARDGRVNVLPEPIPGEAA